MRRILTVLAVAALMAAMMAFGALPAFADKGGGGHKSECEYGDTSCVMSGGGRNPYGGGSGGSQLYGADSPLRISGGGTSPDGSGGGGHAVYDPLGDPYVAFSGGGSGPDGGAGGRCELDLLDGSIVVTKEAGTADCS